MSAQFKPFHGDWITLRSLNPREVDLNFGRRERDKEYGQMMEDLRNRVAAELREAQEHGQQYVLFRHGSAASLGWSGTTARSAVRSFMRSADATPFVVRKECLQGDSVFLARIRSAASTGEAAAHDPPFASVDSDRPES
jgi:hypothetical protein